MKRFSNFIQESIDLEEQKMTFQDAEKLKSKHLAAMQHHKKSGNPKGYAAHSMVVDKFEDAYDRHGTGVIPVGRIMSASQKAFKDHPHSSMKEEFELDEASKEHLERLKAMLDKAKPGSADHSQIRHAISTQYGDKHIPAKHRNVKPDMYEAVSVKKNNYSWGKMITVHHGASHSFPLHPEHQEKIRKLESGEKTTFKDETGKTITASRDGDTIHLKQPGSNKKTPVARSHFTEEVNLDEAAMPIALRTFAMGARRVGQRLVQLHDDIKRIENVDQQDIVDEMNAIKKEFDGLMASIRKTAALLKSVKMEGAELDEAVEVSHDRYMRSHGKKASGTGGWFFTHKSGAVNNLDDPKEVHFKQGKFSDAKKSAQQWAKKHGHSTVYVMEEVEQIDEISDEKKKEYIRAVADKGGIFRKPRPGSLAGFDRRKEKALVKAFKGGSMQDYVKLHKKSEKRAGIAHKALDSLKKEEVEQIDEISNELKQSYVDKGAEDVYNRFTGRGKYEKPRNPAHYTKTGKLKKGVIDRPDAVKYREKLANRRGIVNKVSKELTGKPRFNSIGEEAHLTESHFKVGQRVECVRSGMTGTVVKSDKPEVGKYYTVKQDSGKLMKYAPDELKAI